MHFLTYDDIQLVPSYSSVSSRKNISLVTKVTKNYSLCIPLVASCMDTVCEHKMAIAIAQMGGVGCIHRFMTIEQQSKEIEAIIEGLKQEKVHAIWKACNIENIPVMAAVGAVVLLVITACAEAVHPFAPVTVTV